MAAAYLAPIFFGNDGYYGADMCNIIDIDL